MGRGELIAVVDFLGMKKCTFLVKRKPERLMSFA